MEGGQPTLLKQIECRVSASRSGSIYGSIYFKAKAMGLSIQIIRYKLECCIHCAVQRPMKSRALGISEGILSTPNK